ncbi:exodeoxyribonuclease V subunit gamma [Halomonas denitrificans]|uniref:exodeoxyribonuclease V subunit gamma n=1 Tax=Halomonas TaxID=2745 RepID=UPI001C93FC48|nr:MULTISPECIES: exodeoxyribonuclease V subunit gamma [Halomonas]MBY6030444.1 exodeoxyribonuclease V subunit gamma [Halomonas sp. DP8Y7-1]MCA0973767.1 exodeoxyribonuclease V subunit gamma [Halomonas denitrificans]
MTDTAASGMIVLQGNRMEDLRDLTLKWLGRRPLHPLARTLFLVQSNGIAQWLKTSIAERQGAPGYGICLGTDVALPARLQWQAYRAVIEDVEGPGTVPTTSPFDKSRLRWRLMELLPKALMDPLFAPLERYLRDDDERRKHYQLAERLADLFDQYQVYRADWLSAWEKGDDSLILPGNRRIPVPEEQLWQPALWRMIGDSLEDGLRHTHRGAIHQRFKAAAETLQQRPDELPPRIVVFGISSLPQQTLEVLAALSGVCEVVLCLLNPCQFYWGEIIETQEVLRRHVRQRRREGMPADLHQSLEHLHLHAHPLLAAWGKQGRDYLQLLSEHDHTDVEAMSALLDGAVDLFLEPPTEHLLGQLQDDILNLRPLSETQQTWPALDPEQDGSIRFHICHSPQRELEVLHDQLLASFAADPTLEPRDIMVMVPDINDYAPYIDAVFGQFAPGERRHLPYHVADQQQRHREPLLVALETLLSLPRMRFRASEILDLLDIPAVRERFGLSEGDLPTLQRWIREANVRWGLDAAQRAELGLPEHDELHTWRFGLERMLMGYAVGEAEDSGDDWLEVVPYDEVAGLDAALVGPLYRLIMTLSELRQLLSAPRPAADWDRVLSTMLERTLTPSTSAEQTLMGRIQASLETWQEEITSAAVTTDLPLAVVRESWLSRIDDPQLSQSFMMGRITFATLMPMRAIPFRQVVLLGMNDGAYPRQATAMDFDLMAMRGHYRAGDRSRRDDDRYLFLEALLSARERLTISWCGRSPQDNGEKPPSVLVGQLRDHLAKGWRLPDQPPHAQRSLADDAKMAEALLEALTAQHPLQPFGAAYFQADSRLFTYADEWQDLHAASGSTMDTAAGAATGATADSPGSAVDSTDPHGPHGADSATNGLGPWQPEGPLQLSHLAGLLRDPVEALFQQRLSTSMRDDNVLNDDDEPFGFAGLAAWQQREALVQPIGQQLAHRPDDAASLSELIDRQVLRQQRAGHYPPAPVGPVIRQRLLERIPAALEAYRALLARYPYALEIAPRVSHDSGLTLDASRLAADDDTQALTLRLEDTLTQLHADRPLSLGERQGEKLGEKASADASAEVARIVLLTSQIHQGEHFNWRQILRHWPAHLALQTLYPGAVTHLVSPSGQLTIPGMTRPQAEQRLNRLMERWQHAMQHATPTHPDIAFNALEAYPAADDPDWPPPDLASDPKLRTSWEDRWERLAERSPLMLREFPTLEALVTAPDFADATRELYADLHTWISRARQSPLAVAPATQGNRHSTKGAKA